MGQAAEQFIPKTIGRYQVIGRLAMGGMAEILLGRLHGPSGFERPVVIKRILPHLAQIPSFVNMFLDEARIAARIGHPNVVQVQELGREGEDLYLVMEYLEGESAASLMRRITSRGRIVEPVVAAHVVAQAAAGLHAAHELKDPQGQPQQLVHRDMSPQNLFITYAGVVKVLDFGIAKAADRIAQTEAGVLKGKFDYMSPEQSLGEEIDRRSDMFSLGIVLYEVSTGRRLFRRKTQVQTLRAVGEAEVVPPSQIVPGYPEELEEICMRALQRRPEDRYQTAAEMRRDLISAMTSLRRDALPDEILAALLTNLFPDRIQQKQSMIDAVRSGTQLTEVPSAEADVDVELPSIDKRASGPDIEHPSASKVVSVAGTLEAARSKPRLGLWLVAGAILSLAAGSLAAWAALGGDEDPRTPEPRAAGAAAAVSPGAGDPEPDGEPAAETEAGRQQQAEPTAAAAPAAPANVRLTIVTHPDGATVFIDDAQKGQTPLDVELPRSQEAAELRLELDGHETVVESLVPRTDQLVRIGLERERRRRARRRVHQVAEPSPEPAAEPEPAGRGFRRFD